MYCPRQADAESDAGSEDAVVTPTDTASNSSQITEEHTADDRPVEHREEALTQGAAEGTSLQAAFSRYKQQFVKNSQARVEKAKAKRYTVKPRVQLPNKRKPPPPPHRNTRQKNGQRSKCTCVMRLIVSNSAEKSSKVSYGVLIHSIGLEHETAIQCVRVNDTLIKFKLI